MSSINLPKIGLGTMRGRNEKAVNAYSEAIKMGYRFIDTAQIYFNEKTMKELGLATIFDSSQNPKKISEWKTSGTDSRII